MTKTPVPAPADCPNSALHGNPYRYCPSCTWTEEPDTKESEKCIAPSAPPLQLDNLLRNEDKLYLIERLIELQAPLGSDMADFRRRLLLVVRA